MFYHKFNTVGLSNKLKNKAKLALKRLIDSVSESNDLLKVWKYKSGYKKAW